MSGRGLGGENSQNYEEDVQAAMIQVHTHTHTHTHTHEYIFTHYLTHTHSLSTGTNEHEKGSLFFSYRLPRTSQNGKLVYAFKHWIKFVESS
jgi:hypothetical protein